MPFSALVKTSLAPWSRLPKTGNAPRRIVEISWQISIVSAYDSIDSTRSLARNSSFQRRNNKSGAGLRNAKTCRYIWICHDWGSGEESSQPYLQHLRCRIESCCETVWIEWTAALRHAFRDRKSDMYVRTWGDFSCTPRRSFSGCSPTCRVNCQSKHGHAICTALLGEIRWDQTRIRRSSENWLWRTNAPDWQDCQLNKQLAEVHHWK